MAIRSRHKYSPTYLLIDSRIHITDYEVLLGDRYTAPRLVTSQFIPHHLLGTNKTSAMSGSKQEDDLEATMTEG